MIREKCLFYATKRISTLEYRIIVPTRLLIFENFFHPPWYNSLILTYIISDFQYHPRLFHCGSNLVWAQTRNGSLFIRMSMNWEKKSVALCLFGTVLLVAIQCAIWWAWKEDGMGCMGCLSRRNGNVFTIIWHVRYVTYR